MPPLIQYPLPLPLLLPTSLALRGSAIKIIVANETLQAVVAYALLINALKGLELPPLRQFRRNFLLLIQVLARIEQLLRSTRHQSHMGLLHWYVQCR